MDRPDFPSTQFSPKLVSIIFPSTFCHSNFSTSYLTIITIMRACLDGDLDDEPSQLRPGSNLDSGDEIDRLINLLQFC